MSWREIVLPLAERGAGALASYARNFPLRVIEGETGPYLSRWTLEEKYLGGWVYLHHFHRSDPSGELHSHPWAGRSLILLGGYREHREGGVFERRPGDEFELGADTFHRVDLADPVAGCWTLFETGPYLARGWAFKDLATGRVTPWRDALKARGLL